MTRSHLSRWRRAGHPAVVGIIASALIAGASYRVLATFDFDPTVFLGIGQDSSAILTHVEPILGRTVETRGRSGHDGQWFLIQSLDPWLNDPGTFAELVDAPAYRAQRMLYPLVASLGGLLSPALLPWSMLIVNIVSFGLGAAGVARFAQLHGRSPFWGFLFLLNIGVLAEYLIDGAGVLSLAAAVWAVVNYSQARFVRSTLFLTIAVLAREVMLLSAMGLTIVAWLTLRRIHWRLAVVPAAVAAGWGVYVRGRLSRAGGIDEAGALTWPFAGMLRVIPDWLADPLSLVTGVMVLVLLATFLSRTIRGRDPMSWATVGFVAVSPLLSELVWRDWFNITRATAPSILGFMVLTTVVGPTIAPAPGLREAEGPEREDITESPPPPL